MDLDLVDLESVVRSIGRGIVCRAAVWTPAVGSPLVLEQLGDTEGNISINANAMIESLTTPELTGPAAHETDFVGENPQVEIPLYLASPAMLALVSPGGSKHGGRSMRTSAAEHTLVIFPEGLFIVNAARKRLSFDGDWKVDGQALTAAQQALLDMSVWFWRGHFNRPPRRFLGGAGNDRKQIESVSFQAMHHADMPEGHHLYTVGDPADAAIDLLGGS